MRHGFCSESKYVKRNRVNCNTASILRQLFVVGKSKLVCYLTLNRFILSQQRGKDNALSFYNTLVDNFSTLNRTFDVTYSDWLVAKDGFLASLSLDVEEAFQCGNCGKSPRYLVADGTSIAPTKRKLMQHNLSELGPHPHDKQSLSQGSTHEIRTFISSSKDRKVLTKFLAGDMTISQFSQHKEITSENAKLIVAVVKRLKANNLKDLPLCYSKFLVECSKNVPVAGIIQVTGKKPLRLGFIAYLTLLNEKSLAFKAPKIAFHFVNV